MTQYVTSRLAALGLALGLGLVGFAPAAGALTLIDFDALPSLSDVAAASLPGVAISSALVASEADAALLTGFDSASWARSPANGLLNLYGGGTISLRFATPITHVGYELTVFPLDTLTADRVMAVYFFVSGGVTAPVEITEGIVPDADLFLHFGHDTAFSGAVERIDLFAASDAPSTFFLDDLRFTPVPEPGTVLCVATGLLALALRRRCAR